MLGGCGARSIWNGGHVLSDGSRVRARMTLVTPLSTKRVPLTTASFVAELVSLLGGLERLAVSEPRAVDALAGLLCSFPTELIVLEHEHADRDGVCSHCPEARSWPCAYVRACWDARVALEWPLPGAARQWAGHA